jgi:hypothetical protein
MTTAEKLRAGFLERSRREKLLAALFLVVLAAIWLFFLVGQIRTFRPELNTVRVNAREQANWLENKVSIQQRYDEAYRSVSAIETPSGKDALAKVDEIARRYGYPYRIDPPQPVKREQLTFHPINVNVSKADFTKLADMYRDITAALPTVNLDEVTLALPDRNGQLLEAKFKFVAIEINH